MDLVVYDDDEQRYVPWAVAVAAVLLVALLTAVLTFLLARQASGGAADQAVGGVTPPDPATAPSAAPTADPADPDATDPEPASTASTPAASPACVAALQLADRALGHAGAVDEALTQHTAIMDELLAERITPQQALDQTLPVLTDGATDRRRFEQVVADYRDAREQCPG